ncbi:hypothetical protein CIB93_09160 [Streptomyces sp. WZ.A104]|uniref:hypothetical protein n=1 Tax=Streptomyces sp. WZ.A104 TaxID=2023771 RepID=UPI000BBCB4EE|nr:hypothetical protein [Streptomyces sp. WZ.A104]PCG86389.1 hypothetical protein CIB93_09160 [Streptomyces sp. WZ.A104]
MSKNPGAAEPDHVPHTQEIGELRAGQRVTVTGKDTRGYSVTRTGRILAAPRKVMAQDWGKRVKRWRLHVSDEPDAMPAHSNSVATPLNATAELLPDA